MNIKFPCICSPNWIYTNNILEDSEHIYLGEFGSWKFEELPYQQMSFALCLEAYNKSHCFSPLLGFSVLPQLDFETHSIPILCTILYNKLQSWNLWPISKIWCNTCNMYKMRNKDFMCNHVMCTRFLCAMVINIPYIFQQMLDMYLQVLIMLYIPVQFNINIRCNVEQNILKYWIEWYVQLCATICSFPTGCQWSADRCCLNPCFHNVRYRPITSLMH